MSGIKPFHLLNSTLEGTNLIEASAGTGKTYALAGLFIRLILEKELSVREILVVTFTDAATAELKDRIRNKLREAISLFTGDGTEDIFLKGLSRRIEDSKTALRYLREALRTFDEAAIFTIHGFCRRVLHENAFESGSLFDTELMTDQEQFKREIVEDFWRKHLYGASSLFVQYVMDHKFGPETLLSLISVHMENPYLKIIPQVEMPDSSPQEMAYRISFDEVRNLWPTSRREVEGILTSHEGLNRQRYRRGTVPLWIRGMDHYVSSQEGIPVLFKGFEKFTTSELQSSTRKDYDTPTHPFFESCETLKQRQEELEKSFEQHLLSLKSGLFSYVRSELSKRKTEKNVLSFDDLLLNLYRALYGRGGKTLAEAMGRKFKAALIDEFQDTDPVSYAIFKKVFDDEKSILFLIGDPKQAIYGFRGADIFTYMRAARDVKTIHTLLENWRTEPHLIRAINTIFAHVDHPFLYGEIPFQPAEPAEGKDPLPLKLAGQVEPPFRLWFLDAGKHTENDRPLSKTQARQLIPEAVAGEISRLLMLAKEGKAVIGDRPLKERDIAVLVRKNAEARLMQEALSALQIPGVLYSTGNLFDSHEALELERILASIVAPNNEKILRAALATDIMGLHGEEIEALIASEEKWERWLVRFMEYRDLWVERGFFRMFRHLLGKEEILIRLISLPDGERRSTNLLHLSEVLHQTSVEKKLNMEGLFKWFTEQRDPSTPRSEEHQLRLESDENAVKLVTIHKSKGLEYPVLFCPFAWDGSRLRHSDKGFTFHDRNNHWTRTLDLGSENSDENLLLAEEEQLAENLRLLYVALTRSKQCCYLVWGRFNEADTSAPAYLLHHPGGQNRDHPVKATGKRFKTLSDEELFEELKTVQANSHGTIHLTQMPEGTAESYTPPKDEEISLSSREFSGSIDRQWRISSFSSLVSGRRLSPELADRDELTSIREQGQNRYEDLLAEDEPSGIFAFPKGARAGIFLHDLLEHMDYREKDVSRVNALVTDKLKEYGFEPTWLGTISLMIRRILSISLEPGTEGLLLSNISNRDRLNELEFYFPIKYVSPDLLKQLFTPYARHEIFRGFPERIDRLDFSPSRGFMKGFMDMVFRFRDRFYLVDWKSNYLGSRVEDYGQEALTALMEDDFYILQYHIYTLALNQYLKLRLPGYDYETHFGGVYYIFLRGVDPDMGNEFGIFRDRPSGEFINELCENLIERHGNCTTC